MRIDVWASKDSMSQLLGRYSPETRESQEERIRTLVENRLRLVNLYDTKSQHEITIRVNVARGCHILSMSYARPFYSADAQQSGTATVWAESMTLQGSSQLLNNLSRIMDDFLLKYKQVNGATCEGQTQEKR